MDPPRSMQAAVIPYTGYPYDARYHHFRKSMLGIPHSAESYGNSNAPFGQYGQHLRAPSINSNGLHSAADVLIEPQRDRWQRFLSSASKEALDSTCRLLQSDDEEWLICQHLREIGQPFGSIARIAIDLGQIPIPVLDLINDLHGDDHRQEFVANVVEARNAVKDKTQPFSTSNPFLLGRRRGSGAGLSPTSAQGCSSTSPSSASSLNPQFELRYFCPAVDCMHKLEGFAKPGYCHNHVYTIHPTFIDNNPNWEPTALRVSVNEGEQLTRRRSHPRVGEHKRKKRGRASSTPEDTTSGAGGVFSRALGDMPMVDQSASPLVDELGGASTQPLGEVLIANPLRLCTSLGPQSEHRNTDAETSFQEWPPIHPSFGNPGVPSAPDINITPADPPMTPNWTAERPSRVTGLQPFECQSRNERMLDYQRDPVQDCWDPSLIRQYCSFPSSPRPPPSPCPPPAPGG